MQDEQPIFFEARPFRRGLGSMFYAGGGVLVVLLATTTPIAMPFRLLGWLAGALMVSILALRFETTVGAGVVCLEVRPFWRKRIDVHDVTSTEVVLADFQIPWFGGWNAREDVTSAVVTRIEGDRSFGRSAVRLHLQAGGFQQVGTFRPGELLAAIETAQRS